MPIITIDNYQVNVRKPIDTRMTASNSVAREAISGTAGYPYDGLICFQIDTKENWQWTGSTWSLMKSGGVSGTGSINQATRYNSTATLLEDSAIYASGSVGINTRSPKEIFQVNNTGTFSMSPFTVRKDTLSALSDNLYFDPSFGGTDLPFLFERGSSSVKLMNGNHSFITRSPSSSVFTQSTINSLGYYESNSQIRVVSGDQTTPSYSWSIDSDTGIFYNQGTISVSNDSIVTAEFGQNIINLKKDTIISSNVYPSLAIAKTGVQVIITPTQSISSNKRQFISNKSGYVGVFPNLLNAQNENWITYTKSGGTWSGLNVNESISLNDVKATNAQVANGSYIQFRQLGSGILFFNQSLLISSSANRLTDKVQLDFATPLIGAGCDGFMSIVDTESYGIPPSTVLITATANNQWNNGGALVYATYSTDGTGPGSQPYGASTWIQTPHFWVNGATIFDAASRNFIDGRMNAAGIWFTPGPADNIYLGFRRVFNVPSTRTYYVGMSADNYFRISFNGTIVVNQTNNVNFGYFHIYPIVLQAGPNIIEMSAANAGSVAGMVAEIYDNTLSQLQAATNISQLNVLFTTAGLAGQVPDLVPVLFGPSFVARSVVTPNNSNILNGSTGTYSADTFSLTNYIGLKGTGMSMSINSTYRINGYGVIAATALSINNVPGYTPVVSPLSITLNLSIGQAFSVSLTASENPSSWAITTVPAWMTLTFAGSNATLSGTPTSKTASYAMITATNYVGTSTATASCIVNFTVINSPSITQISNTDTGPGGYRTQTFTIGSDVSAGNVFSVGVYSGSATVTAVAGDTAATIATKLANIVNNGRTSNVIFYISSYMRWRDLPSAPTTGLPGGTTAFYASYPSASTSGANLTLVLNYQNQFGGSATP